jgi:hypothetical protein
VNAIFAFRRPENAILAGPWGSSGKGYLDSIESSLCILSPENAIPAELINPRPMTNWLPVSQYSAFWRTENVIS